MIIDSTKPQPKAKRATASLGVRFSYNGQTLSGNASDNRATCTIPVSDAIVQEVVKCMNKTLTAETNKMEDGLVRRLFRLVISERLPVDSHT